MAQLLQLFLLQFQVGDHFKFSQKFMKIRLENLGNLFKF